MNAMKGQFGKMKKNKKKVPLPHTVRQVIFGSSTVYRLASKQHASPALRAIIDGDYNFMLRAETNNAATESFTQKYAAKQTHAAIAVVDKPLSSSEKELEITGTVGHKANYELQNVAYKSVIDTMAVHAVKTSILRAMKKDASLAANATHVCEQIGRYLGYDVAVDPTTDSPEASKNYMMRNIIKPAKREAAARNIRRNVLLAKRALRVLKDNPAATFDPI